MDKHLQYCIYSMLVAFEKTTLTKGFELARTAVTAWYDNGDITKEEFRSAVKYIDNEYSSYIDALCAEGDILC